MIFSINFDFVAAIAVVIITTAIVSFGFFRKKNHRDVVVEQLEASLKFSLQKCAAERQGRINAQQALRKSFTECGNKELTSYPVTPIGVIHSCFPNRNGTPRQPLLVSLARDHLTLYSDRIPLDSLEGLGEYSHCWIIYVFHLNTDLEKLWRHPSRSKFKAKVRVPRLKGGKMGVFATRSPHRPCPIGLTVAKLDAVIGHTIFLSGVDLVDETPVLDVKPYLPYSDSVEEACVPDWVKQDHSLAVECVLFSEAFSDTLIDSWNSVGRFSLYKSPADFQSFIKQVLSWDIRSSSQRKRRNERTEILNSGQTHDLDSIYFGDLSPPMRENETVYHLNVDFFDVAYIVDGGCVMVDSVSICWENFKKNKSRYCGCIRLKDDVL